MNNTEHQKTHHLNRIATSLERIVEMIEEAERREREETEAAVEVPTEFEDAR